MKNWIIFLSFVVSAVTIYTALRKWGFIKSVPPIDRVVNVNGAAVKENISEPQN